MRIATAGSFYTSLSAIFAFVADICKVASEQQWVVQQQ